jgi:O-antigen ligase
VGSRAHAGPGRASSRHADGASRRLRGLVLALVLLAPVPLGANRPWAWSLLAAATGGLLLAWGGLGLRRRRAEPPVPAWLWPPAVLFALVAAFIVAQTVPGMPEGIAHPSWALVAEAGIGAPRDSISIAPDATLTALMRLLAYAAVFWLGLQLFGTLGAAERALVAIALVSAAYSVAALVLHLSGSNLILWLEKWAHQDSLTGTFANRNHFATFTGIGLLACQAGLLRRLRLGVDPDAADPEVLLGRLLGPSATLLALGAAGLVNLVALLLSRSRAGIAATLIAAAVLLVGVLWRAGNRRAAGLVMLGLFGLPMLFYLTLAGGGFFDRLALLLDPETVEVRFPLFGMVAEAIADHPWQGVGYGAFEDAFRMYRAPPIDLPVRRAHSSYLELAMEIGLPASAALVLAVLWLALVCARALWRRRVGFLPGWTAACTSLLVGLHAAVDFSLQIPAVAVLYALVLGIGCRQAEPRRPGATAG